MGVWEMGSEKMEEGGGNKRERERKEKIND